MAKGAGLGVQWFTVDVIYSKRLFSSVSVAKFVFM